MLNIPLSSRKRGPAKSLKYTPFFVEIRTLMRVMYHLAGVKTGKYPVCVWGGGGGPTYIVNLVGILGHLYTFLPQLDLLDLHFHRIKILTPVFS